MDTPSISFKQCSRKGNCVQFGQCGWLPATTEYFPPMKLSKDGMRPECRACNKASRKKQWQEQPESFEATKAYLEQYRKDHRQKANEYAVKYRAEHKQENNEKARLRRKSNPEKARIDDTVHYYKRRNQEDKNGGQLSSKDIRFLLKTWNGRCWWCNKKIRDGNFHLDHRIPLSRGGSNSLGNLCVSCPHCNLTKHNKLPQEWNGRLL